MTALAHLISIVMGCLLAPVGIYVVWHLLKVVLEMIPATRDRLDFWGVDLGQPRPPRPRRIRATATRVRRLGRAPGAIDAEPATRELPRKRLALPAGATAGNQAAEVAP